MTAFQKAILAVLSGGILTIALVLAAKTPAGAAATLPLSGGTQPTVLVPGTGAPPPGVLSTGEGTVKVRPDLAVVSIGVTVQALTAAEAQSQVAERIAKILERAKQLGIAAKDIANAGWRVEPQYAYGEGRAPRLTGFQATQQLSLNVRQVDGVGKVLDALVADGATNASVRFTLEDPKQAQAEARRLAVEDARAKADAMARAAGVRLGKAVSLSEVSLGGPIFRERDFAAPMPAKAVTEIPVSDLDVVVRVQVQFAID